MPLTPSDPSFSRGGSARASRAREHIRDHTADRFRNLVDSSLDTLERHVNDRYAPTAHRAARTLLTLAKITDYPAVPNRAAPLPPIEPWHRGNLPAHFHSS